MHRSGKARSVAYSQRWEREGKGKRLKRSPLEPETAPVSHVAADQGLVLDFQQIQPDEDPVAVQRQVAVEASGAGSEVESAVKPEPVEGVNEPNTGRQPSPEIPYVSAVRRVACSVPPVLPTRPAIPADPGCITAEGARSAVKAAVEACGNACASSQNSTVGTEASRSKPVSPAVKAEPVEAANRPSTSQQNSACQAHRSAAGVVASKSKPVSLARPSIPAGTGRVAAKVGRPAVDKPLFGPYPPSAPEVTEPGEPVEVDPEDYTYGGVTRLLRACPAYRNASACCVHRIGMFNGLRCSNCPDRQLGCPCYAGTPVHIIYRGSEGRGTFTGLILNALKMLGRNHLVILENMVADEDDMHELLHMGFRVMNLRNFLTQKAGVASVLIENDEIQFAFGYRFDRRFKELVEQYLPVDQDGAVALVKAVLPEYFRLSAKDGWVPVIE